MSWNNITPWWLIELNFLIKKCEDCLPEERLEVYAEAANNLRSIPGLPEVVLKKWLGHFEGGITWNKMF